jgi:MFS family permease
MKIQKLWTKDFIIATVSGLFSSMVFYITMTTFAIYAVTTYHVNESIAGLVAGVFVIGSAIGRLLSGKHIERFGRRKMILLGGVLFFLIGLAYLIPMRLILFLIIRFLHGATFGVFHNTLATVVTGIIPTSRRGEGMGYFSLNFVLATAFGPFIGLYFIHQFSYRVLFVICSIFALLALALFLFMKVETPQFPAERLLHPKAKHSLKDYFEKKALPIATIIIIMSMCYTGVTAFLDSYAADLNFPNFPSVFFIVYGAVIIIVRPLAGKLLDKKGDNIVMLPTIIFFAASLFALGVSKAEYSLIIAAILMALGYGNILTIGQAIAVNSAPSHRVGIATSTYFIFNDLGQGFGPFLMGIIATSAGFANMYFVEAGIVTFSVLLYYILHGARVRESKMLRNKSV